MGQNDDFDGRDGESGLDPSTTLGMTSLSVVTLHIELKCLAF